MIVVAIIGIIAAIAIPTLISTRATAQMTATKAVLRTVASAESTYFAKHAEFVDMVTLSGLGILDNRFASYPVELNAYSIAIEIRNGGLGFLVTATPTIPAAPTLTVDETYLIRES